MHFFDLGRGKNNLDGLGDPVEIVHYEDQNVLHSAVLQLIEDREPVLGRFGLGGSQPRAFLLTIEVYPDDRVQSHVPDMALEAHLQERGIHINQGVDGFQRPALPFPGPLHHFVRDGDHRPGRTWLQGRSASEHNAGGRARQ
jgi:hypothetical protein